MSRLLPILIAPQASKAGCHVQFPKPCAPVLSPRQELGGSRVLLPADQACSLPAATHPEPDEALLQSIGLPCAGSGSRLPPRGQGLPDTRSCSPAGISQQARGSRATTFLHLSLGSQPHPAASLQGLQPLAQLQPVPSHGRRSPLPDKVESPAPSRVRLPLGLCLGIVRVPQELVKRCIPMPGRPLPSQDAQAHAHGPARDCYRPGLAPDIQE